MELFSRNISIGKDYHRIISHFTNLAVCHCMEDERSDTDQERLVVGRAWYLIRPLLVDKQLHICVSESTLVTM